MKAARSDAIILCVYNLFVYSKLRKVLLVLCNSTFLVKFFRCNEHGKIMTMDLILVSIAKMKMDEA